MDVASEMVLKRHYGNSLCHPYEAYSSGQELADAGLSPWGIWSIIVQKDIALLDYNELNTGSHGTDCPVSCNKLMSSLLQVLTTGSWGNSREARVPA